METLLESAFNHVVLPPKLPGAQDSNLLGLETFLLKRMIDACTDVTEAVRPHCGDSDGHQVLSALTALRTILLETDLIHGELLVKDQLAEKFGELGQRQSGVILYVREQNAGLLIRTQGETNVRVVFEAFEASPTSSRAVAADALQWDFPDAAASVDGEDFSDPSFRASVARFLDQASCEAFEKFAAHSVKTKGKVVETRDTIDPALITQTLIPVIRSFGRHENVTPLRKAVRDDVCWDNAELPWRRSPFWLILRVAAQRILTSVYDAPRARAVYKFVMSRMIADLLQDSSGRLGIDKVMLLLQKLSRRMAKLETDRLQAEQTDDSVSFHVYGLLFSVVGPRIRHTIAKANQVIQHTWEIQKRRTLRCIPKLPPKATQEDMRLTLPNSQDHIDFVLSNRLTWAGIGARPALPQDINDNQLPSLAKCAHDVMTLEAAGLDEQALHAEKHGGMRTPEELVSILSRRIQKYLGLSVPLYSGSPELMSRCILTALNMWVVMDLYAVKVSSCLADYNPVFHASSLNSLQLPHFGQLRKLHSVQTYLNRRWSNATLGSNNIFDDPSPNCFALRYIQGDRNGQRLADRWDEIDQASRNDRRAKKAEWRQNNDQYDRHTEGMQGPCKCRILRDGTYDVGGCTPCWHKRQRRRMKMDVHEDYLPGTRNNNRVKETNFDAAAIVFELEIPEWFEGYRAATWSILRDLAKTTHATASPVLHLADFSPLSRWKNPRTSSIGLVSLTSKSWLNTHWRTQKLPVGLDQVLCNFGPSFTYLSKDLNIKPSGLAKQHSFLSHCRLLVPKGLRIPPQKLADSWPAEESPSSYEIAARRESCPSNLSIHEYTALQTLIGGTHRRWLTILRELGTSNLNLSSDDTVSLLCQLAIQAGPPDRKQPELREMGWNFRDPSFIKRLFEQLQRRLRAIAGSWRENRYMELLLTLILRLFELGDEDGKQAALVLIQQARLITMDWIMNLRQELITIVSVEEMTKRSQSAMMAALLCRRTFEVHRLKTSSIEPADACIYIKASLAFAEQSVGSVDKLSAFQRYVLLRDIRLANTLRNKIWNIVQNDPTVLQNALASAWDDSSTDPRKYTPWALQSYHDGWNKYWVESTASSKSDKKSLIVHYNLLDGRLHVNGKPLGKLPDSFLESDAIKKLFPDRYLRVFISNHDGLDYQLASDVEKWQIHFGRRNSKVFVRAIGHYGKYEYIDHSYFKRSTGGLSDLPKTLIENCAHWLNLRDGHLEIRREPKIWATRPGDWTIDTQKRLAFRRGSRLVDPHSPTSRKIQQIFKGFVDPEYLTVFQSHVQLRIEIKHLQLSLGVQQGGSLKCRELDALVDYNQDPGTWYGHQGMIVLRDHKNAELRTIITPLGNISPGFKDGHASLVVENDGRYGHFGIDSVVGRVTCAPEPELLYAKAQFHAYTSHFLCDPLTGRTGCEEALQFLQSSICQPWSPLTDAPFTTLTNIANLSPARSFYPPYLEVMERVQWSKYLPWYVQHDSYRPVVQKIVDKACALAKFIIPTASQKASDSAPRDVNLAFGETTALRRRGEVRRQRFERPGSGRLGLTRYHKRTVYKPRFFLRQNIRRDVRWILDVVLGDPFKISLSQSLADHVKAWSSVHAPWDDKDLASSLTTIFGKPIDELWWTYVGYCSSNAPLVGICLFLASLSHCAKQDLLAILAAFCKDPSLGSLGRQCPEILYILPFKSGDEPSREKLAQYALAASTELQQRMNHRGRLLKPTVAEQAAHSELCSSESRRLAAALIRQWPQQRPDVSELSSEVMVVSDVLEDMLNEWDRAWQNHTLETYMGKIHTRLSGHQGYVVMSKVDEMPHDDTVSDVRDRNLDILTLDHLLNKPGSQAPDPAPDPSPGSLQNLPKAVPIGPARVWGSGIPARPGPMMSIPIHTRSIAMSRLRSLLQPLIKSGNQLRVQYARDLEESLAVYRSQANNANRTEVRLIGAPEYQHRVRTARSEAHAIRTNLVGCLANNDPRSTWLDAAGLWPMVDTVSLLTKLRSTCNAQFGWGMRELLVKYGVALTALQRHMRIHAAEHRFDQRRINDENTNSGHTNWDPMQNTDWLLLEIDSNILIRPDQVDVARATIKPETGRNSVLQMNMGRGKTSCIMPMAVAELADGKMLCRLVVPKALLIQTAQTVQAKIGYLIGREITHLPFSRRTKLSEELLHSFSTIHQDMQHGRGMMLCLPEHILSFKLSSIQYLADGKSFAKEMIEFQDHLTHKCRDVLDESDFTLAVKTQLIYPSGDELLVDGHPHRWKTIETLLSLAEDHIGDLQKQYPGSLQVVPRSGGFPLVFFLRPDAEDALMDRMIDDIVAGKTPIFRVADPDRPVDHDKLRKVITGPTVTIKEFEKACRRFYNPGVAVKNLLLIRGLVQHRILVLCMKKRWNVQYGLHEKRIPIAVPYEAKGVPSEQAEFGHPDVAIILTCLSFYYTGLTTEQLKQSLERILGSDDPATEYEQWISGAHQIRDELQHWNLVNIDDDGQIRELWNALRLSKNVLDHFLNTFVFPKHAQQFTVKLQASGWDVPLFGTMPDSSEIRSGLTTGFSGTNDNQHMLPLTIAQNDLPGLQQTNAEVLTYLLEERNQGYICATDKTTGARLCEEGILNVLAQQDIRIFIDAGALVLEMSNRKLVEEWLAVYPEAQAAVYFQNGKAMVMYRNKPRSNDQPLIMTLYAENFTDCLVYLDEAHTRGTDLKLPADAVGAVTLGLGQTKDHTVQAAMRLRQLGTTQRVVFVAPPEVDQSIRTTCNKPPYSTPNSTDVVAWLLEQTCRGNEQMRHLYYSQGMDFCRRSNAVHIFPDYKGNKTTAQSYTKCLLLPEHQTLQELYCTRGRPAEAEAKPSSPDETQYRSPVLAGFDAKLREQMGGLGSVDATAIFGNAMEEVEQEREVEFQVEEIRQSQKPPSYPPHTFPGLHEKVKQFALEGTLDTAAPEGFLEAFEMLRQTPIGKKFGLAKSDPKLYASKEWLRTIKTPDNSPHCVLRPVEWILYQRKSGIAMIIISEEAEQIIPLLRKNDTPGTTHLIEYAAPVTKTMSSFNRLLYHSNPPLDARHRVSLALIADIGIVAGRLYFPFSEYEFLEKYLRGTNVGGANTSEADTVVPLGKNALDFLAEWLVNCRKGQDIMHTPMGYLCQGRPLSAGHPFFVDSTSWAFAHARVGADSGSSDASSSRDNDEEDSGSEDDEEWMMEELVGENPEPDVVLEDLGGDKNEIVNEEPLYYGVG